MTTQIVAASLASSNAVSAFNNMAAAVQISRNGVTLYSQGRIQDAMTCFRYVLTVLKSAIQTDADTLSCPYIAQDLPIPSSSSTTNKGTVSYHAGSLVLQPVSLNVSLLAHGDERGMIVASAVAVFNLAIAHHAASLQAQKCDHSEGSHFYMTSAMKLYTLVQSLQHQADSHHDDFKLFSAEQRERSFLFETMIRISTLHNAGVLLGNLNEQREARTVFEHLYHVVFSLRVTPDDFEAIPFDLNAVMARVFLEMNILKERHTAPCA
jgi:hypothetical protein